MNPITNLDRVVSDIRHIESLKPKADNSELTELVSDIKTQLETINQYNFDEVSIDARESLSQEIEKVAEQMEMLFKQNILSLEDRMKIQEAIGTSKLRALGLSLGNLPDEVILMIADHLDRREISDLIVGLNQSLTELIHDERFVASKNTPNQLVIDVIKKFENPEFTTEQLSDKAKEILKEATIFDLSNIPLTGDCLGKIAGLCPNMEILIIRKGVTNQTLYQIPRSIKHLDISDCKNLTADLFNDFDFSLELRPKLMSFSTVVYNGVSEDLKLKLDELEKTKLAEQKLTENALFGISNLSAPTMTSESPDIFNFLSVRYAINQLENFHRPE